LSLEPGDLFNHFSTAESNYWNLIDSKSFFFEGLIASSILDISSDNSTIIISNSMPIRDIDRFGKPSSKQLTLIGNRGASGIDGVISTALGAASSTGDQAILLIGDIAYLHDLSGLLALNKFNLKLIIIEINNNGGGIFYRLPISKYDPPFTAGFRTPHNLDLSHSSDLYGFDFTRVSTIADFNLAYKSAIDKNESCVIEVISDPLSNQSIRENLQNLVIQNI
jgi:2-succinyl-5-enolpyruvyl-6-hydroxy-3-cyclohexene-1-carboxylate synthase